MTSDASWVSAGPGGRVLVDASAGRVAAAALTMSGSCRRRAVIAQHLAWRAVRGTGSSLLVGRRRPLHLDEAGAVFDDVRRELGDDVVPVGILQRRQREREAVLSLWRKGDDVVAFVKAVPTSQAMGLQRERCCLDALERQPVELDGASLRVPRFLAGGEVGRWTWVAHSAVTDRPHRPANGRDAALVASAIGPVLRTVDLSPHSDDEGSRTGAVTVHGDFAPWNLRRVDRRTLVLFDFEDAHCAPPAADATYFVLATAALHARRPAPGLDRASLAHWRSVVTRRLEVGEDPAMNTALLTAIQAAD